MLTLTTFLLLSPLDVSCMRSCGRTAGWESGSCLSSAPRTKGAGDQTRKMDLLRVRRYCYWSTTNQPLDSGARRRGHFELGGAIIRRQKQRHNVKAELTGTILKPRRNIYI